MKYIYIPDIGVMKFTAILICLILSIQISNAQIGIQTNNPDASAVLDITSSDKGLLIPRLTLSSDLSSPTPVVSPATGLLIYNSGSNQDQGFYYWSGSEWKMLKPSEANDVEGPASSTDNAIARFDGTTGTKIQNSGVILDDSENITGVNKLTTAGFTLTTNPGDDKVLVSDASGNGTWQDALPLDIEEDDITIASGVNTLNFEGSVSVTDNGSNKSTVNIGSSLSVEQVIQLSSTSTLNLNDLIIPAAIPWDTELFKDDTTFSHSNSSNPSRITVLTDGIYEINYMFSVENIDNQRKTLRSRLRKNGTTYIDGSASYSFTYSKFDDKSTHVSSSFLVELVANDYIEVMVNGQTNSGDVNLIPDENLLFMRIMRSW